MFDLKIGRHTYQITEKDEFMDNGSCVQLMSQSKEPISWGHKPSPSLSKRAIKEISHYEQASIDHSHGERVQIFTLKSNSPQRP